jgi:hypothetical protein
VPNILLQLSSFFLECFPTNHFARNFERSGKLVLEAGKFV